MEIFSFASVWRAYLACRRRKHGTAQAQKYAMSALDHIVNTAQALQNRSFIPSRSVCFIARQPKAREIHAATFADRVVHHLLVPRLEAIFEPIFIYDLYSNRTGKGTHAAVNRLQNFMLNLTGDGQTAYFLQLDISNFFNSINRRRLFGLIKYRIEKSIQPSPLVGEGRVGGTMQIKSNTIASRNIVKNARELRKNMTDAEQKLWSKLKTKQIGVKFRRQTPIGTYIVDFVSFNCGLIIEIDGGQHALIGQIDYDQQRTLFLTHQGFKVIRFWNHEVLNNIDGVLAVIAVELDKLANTYPPPQPSPTRGG